MADATVDRDDPHEIARYLIDTQGIEGAFRAVMDCVERCHGDGDNYALSVWREVRNLLRAAEDAEG